jgi:2-amino-4-hydroxy-6-hydroxymethyldihydropteridine diphosphokinase
LLLKKLYVIKDETSLRRYAYISLGSNRGQKQDNLDRACQYINELKGVDICKMSSLYLTSPWGKTAQDDFINQVVEIQTELSPLELLHALQDIEIKMGRCREEKWGPRVIDLDILMYEDEKSATEELRLPHPLMLDRLFVLVPLAEIKPDLVFADGTGIKEVLNRVAVRDGSQKVDRINI